MRAYAFSLLCEDIITVCLGEKKREGKGIQLLTDSRKSEQLGFRAAQC